MSDAEPSRRAESRSAYLLDTSAILAFLEDEEGAARVEAILRQESVLLPFVAALEVYYITAQERGEPAADARYATLKSLPAVQLSEVDEPTLLTAGELQALHPMSLADAMIAAFAMRHGAVLVHKDPDYAVLDGVVRQEVLPPKPPRHPRRK